MNIISFENATADQILTAARFQFGKEYAYAKSALKTLIKYKFIAIMDDNGWITPIRKLPN